VVGVGEVSETLHRLLNDPTLQIVALGTTLLGIVSGMLGTFAVLRRQSLLGDAISHSALPGIGVAFFLLGKEPFWFIVGAAISGWLSTLVVLSITRHTRLSFDSALAGTLAVFFGFGLMLMSYLKRNVPEASQAGLEKYLFGQAATMLERDVWLIGGFGLLAGLILFLFWKELKLITFDPGYAQVRGYPVKSLDRLLMFLLVITIVIGLQSVGVVLMSALIVAPALAGRQCSNRFGPVLLLAGLFGGLSGFGGTLLSDALSDRGRSIPTGPTIVLFATGFVLLSFLFGRLKWPQRDANR
jgi:manganese/zinc/iron transport system permease protein